MKSLEGQFTETLIYQDQSRAEQTKMIADSAEGARREVPQLMQVEELVRMWMRMMMWRGKDDMTRGLGEMCLN